MWKKVYNTERAYFIIFLAALSCLFGYSITKIYGFMLYPDEFGYWAAAARLLGYDWSESVSLGSYYSFGYGLLLLPILVWVKDPVMAYRTAVGCNFVMVCISMLLIWKMVKRLFPKLPSDLAVFFSGIVIFYPSVLFYMQMTMVETAILFFYIVFCFLFIQYLDSPRFVYALALAGTLSGLYFLHMRTVGVVIAGVMALILLFWKRPVYRKSLLATFFLGIILVLLGLYGKDLFTGQLYYKTETQLLTVNDYAGQIGKLQELFSWEGIKSFFVSFVGKLFYLGISSFGIFYWGIGFLISKVVILFREWKRKEEKNYILYFYLFLLLAVLGQLAISAIYMMHPGNVDMLIYGRYNEFLLPPILLLGLYQMMQSKYLVRVTVGIIVIQLIVVLFINYLIGIYNLTGIRGYFVVGLSYVLQDGAFDSLSFFGKVFAFGSIFTIGCAGLVLLVQKKVKFSWLFSLMILLLIMMGLQASRHYIVTFNDTNYLDLTIVEAIKKEKTEQISEIIHVYEEGATSIALVQFQLPREDIKVVQGQEVEEYQWADTAMVIVSMKSEYRDNLREQFEHQVIGGSLCLYYN